jgi:hypothetical protein
MLMIEDQSARRAQLAREFENGQCDSKVLGAALAAAEARARLDQISDLQRKYVRFSVKRLDDKSLRGEEIVEDAIKSFPFSRSL